MFSPSAVDEAGKMVSEDGTEVTVEGAVEDQEVEKDEDGQEVIKVYIFKADSGEDDMGEQHDSDPSSHGICQWYNIVMTSTPPFKPRVALQANRSTSAMETQRAWR